MVYRFDAFARRWSLRTLPHVAACAAALLALAAPRALAAERPEAGQPPRPEWALDVERNLENRKVSFEFEDTPLTEAIAFLQILTKVNMIFDPEAVQEKGSEPVTLKVTNERLDAALRQILAPAGLDFALLDEAVFISTPEHLERLRRMGDRSAGVGMTTAMAEELDRKITFEFIDTPFSEAIEFLQRLTDGNIEVSAKAMENSGDVPITFNVTGMPLDVSLRWVCRFADLDYEVIGNIIYIMDPDRLAEMRRQDAEAAEAAHLPDSVRELGIERRLARKVTFEFIETPLSEALQFLQTLTESTIVCDPVSAADRYTTPITLSLTNTRLSVALRWILRMADLDYGLVDGAVFISTPERIASARRALHDRRFADALRPKTKWSREIRRRLERRISFEFAETPLSEAIAFLQTLTKMNMILDPSAKASRRQVTMKVTNMPLDSALRWTCLIAGCDYALVDHAVFISTPERAAMELLRAAERSTEDAAPGDALPEWERELRRKLERKVTFEFVETPLGEALRFFTTLTETPFDLAPEAERVRTTPVSLNITNMPFAVALRWICRLAGCDYSLVDGTVRVHPPEEPEWRREMDKGLSLGIYCVFKRTRAADVVTLLMKQAGLHLIGDAAGRDGMRRHITLELKNVECADALEHIFRECRLAYAVIDEAVFVSTPERIVQVARLEAARLEREAARTGAVEWWEPELRRVLDSPVALQVEDTPIEQALSLLARSSGLAISIDPDRDGPFLPDRVTLDVDDVSAGAALRWLCRLGGADYRLAEKGILVSTPATFRRREIDAALEERVSIDNGNFDMDVAFWVGALNDRTSGRFVVDYALKEEPTIVAHFEGVPARHVLDEVTRRTNTEWAVRDGAVFVSTPEVISGRPERPEPENIIIPAGTPSAGKRDAF